MPNMAKYEGNGNRFTIFTLYSKKAYYVTKNRFVVYPNILVGEKGLTDSEVAVTLDYSG